MNRIDHEKITNLMLYVADKNGQEIDFKKLLKLIYLADRLHLRTHGRTISTDHYVAMKQGPVASTVYDKCKNIAGSKIELGDSTDIASSFQSGSDYYIINATKRPNLSRFSQSEIEAIAKVLEAYGSYSGDQLSKITHDFYEWKKYEEMLKKNDTSFVIEMEDFFEEEDQGTIFAQSKERLLKIKEVYKEDHEF